MNFEKNVETVRTQVLAYQKVLEEFAKQEFQERLKKDRDSYLKWLAEKQKEVRGISITAEERIGAEEKEVFKILEESEVFKQGAIGASVLQLLTQDIAQLDSMDLEAMLETATPPETRMILEYAKKNNIRLTKKPITKNDRMKAFKRICDFCRYYTGLSTKTAEKHAKDCKEFLSNFEKQFKREIEVLTE